jgi:hypothetical protein
MLICNSKKQPKENLQKEVLQPVYKPSPIFNLAAKYGKDRREEILKFLKHKSILVNRKYCLSTKKDPDLIKLLKAGKIVQKRFKYNKRGGISYVTLVDSPLGPFS